LSTLSLRETDPVLICPVFIATARSAMKVSPVSAATVRDHTGPARIVSGVDSVDSFGNRADLVEF